MTVILFIMLMYPVAKEMIRKQAKANPCYEGGKDVMNDIVTYNILNITMFQILIIINKCIVYILIISFYDQKK